MKKLRKEQGITLIALIITIIVLLILALVTINAIQGDGDLIAYANNAGTRYTQEGENENTFIQESIDKINKYSKGDLDGNELLGYIYSSDQNANTHLDISFINKNTGIMKTTLKTPSMTLYSVFSYNEINNEIIINGSIENDLTNIKECDKTQGSIEFPIKEIKDGETIIGYEGAYLLTKENTETNVNIMSISYVDMGGSCVYCFSSDTIAIDQTAYSTFQALKTAIGIEVDTNNSKCIIYNGNEYTLYED